MKTTTHTCDRCKKSGTAQELELYYVGIDVAMRYSTGDRSKRSAEWCGNCLIATGLATSYDITRNGEPFLLENPPTLEEMIRQIVREEVEEQTV
jgi:hypothetical protein